MASILLLDDFKDLMDFLDVIEFEPFEYGVFDCMTALAAWIERRCKVECRRKWQERLRQKTWEEIVEEDGGLVRILRNEARLFSLPHVHKQATGVIAVVEVPMTGPVGGIAMDDHRWVVKSPNGITVGEFKPLGPMWWVPCRQ